MFISLKMPHENATLYHLYFMIIIYFVLPTKSLYLFSPIHYNNDTEFDSYTTKKTALQGWKDLYMILSQNYFLPDHYFTTSLKTWNCLLLRQEGYSKRSLMAGVSLGVVLMSKKFIYTPLIGKMYRSM